jgi:hypothetical protein
MAQSRLPVVRDSAAGAEPAHHAGWLEAQAYCGPAHGQQWLMDPQDGPSAEMLFSLDDGERICYRLILDPLTRRPARDHRGRYLYMPVRYQPASPRSSPVPPR